MSDCIKNISSTFTLFYCNSLFTHSTSADEKEIEPSDVKAEEKSLVFHAGNYSISTAGAAAAILGAPVRGASLPVELANQPAQQQVNLEANDSVAGRAIKGDDILKDIYGDRERGIKSTEAKRDLSKKLKRKKREGLVNNTAITKDGITYSYPEGTEPQGYDMEACRKALQEFETSGRLSTKNGATCSSYATGRKDCRSSSVWCARPSTVLPATTTRRTNAARPTVPSDVYPSKEAIPTVPSETTNGTAVKLIVPIIGAASGAALIAATATTAALIKRHHHNRSAVRNAARRTQETSV